MCNDADCHSWSRKLGNSAGGGDRKSTRLNSSHGYNSYAVFCLTTIFEERQNLEQFPLTPHEISHQRKLSDEHVPYVALSLPTNCNSIIYQLSRRGHRPHALLHI